MGNYEDMNSGGILTPAYNMYEGYDFDQYLDINMLNNRLFCTFTHIDDLDSLVNELTQRYTIMYNKMFVLYSKSNDEYALTYNIDQGNIGSIPQNTILVHRKKDFNVLYTINALNTLIKKLNNGVVDTKYQINWKHYQNSILLTQHDELKQLNTKIYKIINL